MNHRERQQDAALRALRERAAERRAEQDRRDGEPRATVRRLVEEAQNAAHNGGNEADRVAAVVTEQLVAMIEEETTR